MKTLIAIPCMDTVPVEFMSSMINLKKTEDTFYAVNVGSLIYDSRNSFVATAINKGYDRVLWLDSDMVFEPDLLERLSADMDKNNLDYVCGLYFKRKFPTSPVVYKAITYQNEPGKPVVAKAEAYRDYPEGKLFECAGSGFGAVLTKTEMLKTVWERFGPPFDPLQQLGEDLAFCYRAGQLGLKMWCDSSVIVGHAGKLIYDEDVYKQQKMSAKGDVMEVTP